MEIISRNFFRRVRFAALFCLINLGACSKVGNFFAEKCAANNPNCFDPGLEMISSGGKSDLGGDEISSGSSTDDLAPHDVVFNERTNITLTLTNPKLYPLREFTVVFSNPDSGYEILPSDDADACLNVESLDYQESCTVTISYIYDGITTPSETDVTFVFKTPRGQELTFSIPLSKPVILPDFTVSNTDTKYTVEDDVISAPLHLIYNGAAGNYQGTLHVKNWGEEDITNLTVDLTGDVEFWMDATSTCVNAMTLASGDECDVVLNFLPTSTGAFTGTLNFTSGTGAPEDPAHTYTVSGSADQITASDSSFDFGTTFATYPGGTATITVTNPNPNMATDDTCALSLADGTAYSISTSSCTSTLAADSNCSFTVDYMPQATPGTYTDTATLSCELGGEISVDFTSQVFEVPVITWTPEVGETTDFGNVDLGGYHEITYTLTNTSADVALTNLAVTLESPSSDEWSLASTTCTSALPALGTCEAVVRFTTANAGAETAILRATSTTEVTTVDANLTANGTAMELVLTPDPADDTLDSYTYSDREIDAVGSESHTFTLKNNGNRDAIIAGTFDVGSSALFTDTGGGTCAGLAANTLAAGDSCTYIISFTADSAAGVDTATFTVTDSGGAAPVSDSVTLNGETIHPPPVLTWTPEVGETTDFGYVDSSTHKDITFTLTNTSADVALTNLAVTLESSSSAEWTLESTTCTTSLAALGTCDAVVRFTTANSGAETVTLRAASSNESTSVDASLTATGSSMSIDISPAAPYAFIDREVGQAGSETLTLTYTNNGDRPANLATEFTSNADSVFSDTGTTCGGTLNAGDSCDLVISFAAFTEPKVHSGTFRVTDDNAAVDITNDLSLSAETIAGPALDLADDRGNTTPANVIATSDITGAPGDSNNIIDNTPTTRTATYTVRNVGTGPTSPALENISPTLTYVSGTNNTMSITSNTCTGVTLALNDTCTMIITYDPATAGVETSTYTLEISADSVVTGAAYTASVTSIVGNSYEGANLEFTGTVPIDFGVKEISTPSYLSDDIPLENQGATGATNVAYNFSVNPNTVFSKTSGSAPNCGSSIGAGDSCNLTVTFTHSNRVGAFLGTLNTSGDQAGASNSVQIKAATAQALDVDTSALNQSDGNQGQVAVDSNRFYFVHKNTSAGSDPVLITCSRTATGGVNTTACSRLSLVTHFGLDAADNFGGDGSASGPRIVLTSDKILIGFQNKDTNTGASASGNPTVVICDKPGAGSNTVSTCAYEIVNSTANTGRNVSLAVSNSKLVLASATATLALSISICDFDASSAASSNTLTNCTSATTGGANQGTATNVAIDTTGSRILVSSTDQSGANTVLRATVCTYDFSSASGVNSYSACSASSADTVAGVDTGLYPSLAFSGTRLSIGHQKGLSSPEARLTGCTLGAGTNVVSSCTSSDITGASFEGFNTGIALGDNHLWMFAMTTGASGDYTRYSLQVWKCSLSSTSCDATPYYDSVTTKGHDLSEENRRANIPFFDATNNSLYVQYGSLTGGDWTMMNGLLQVGLTPEL